jgi:hypothetical protein
MAAPEIRSDVTTVGGRASRLSQTRLTQSVLPWCTSIALHAAVVIFGITAYQAIQRVAPESKKQIDIPSLEASDMASSDAATLHPLLTGDPQRKIAQDQAMDVAELEGVSTRQGTGLRNALTGGALGEGQDRAELAIGMTSVQKSGGVGGSGNGAGDGSDGGRLAPFGPPGGRGSYSDSKSIFRGAGAKKVVYVRDATGSMMSAFDALRGQTRLAIQGLRPPQSFDIVFINDRNPPPLSPTLLFVTPEAKRRAVEYLDTMAPRGATQPLAAMERAFALQPDVVHLLIDPSDFPDQQAVLDLVKAKAAGGKIRLEIIAFEGRDEKTEAFLKSLAELTRGSYRFITQRDLVGE